MCRNVDIETKCKPVASALLLNSTFKKKKKSNFEPKVMDVN